MQDVKKKVQALNSDLGVTYLTKQSEDSKRQRTRWCNGRVMFKKMLIS